MNIYLGGSYLPGSGDRWMHVDRFEFARALQVNDSVETRSAVDGLWDKGFGGTVTALREDTEAPIEFKVENRRFNTQAWRLSRVTINSLAHVHRSTGEGTEVRSIAKC